MATEDDCFAVLTDLTAADWSARVRAVAVAAQWLRDAAPGDARVDWVVTLVANLVHDQKWEVRHAVASVAGRLRHDGFDNVLARLATDDNARVRQAAQQAMVRRRDWRAAGALGRQHEQRVNATLDDIEARFGVRGRQAVKRASEEIANTFTRELYHETVKLITPLAIGCERLSNQLAERASSAEELLLEAGRIVRHVEQLRAVLEAMRAYAAMPVLSFSTENVRDMFDEGAALVASTHPDAPPIEVRIDSAITVEVSRTRLLQAITNVLANSVEAYVGQVALKPVVVDARRHDGYVAIDIRDFGRGMSEEVLIDAPTLFSTGKQNGTGFGLPIAIKIIESEHHGRLRLESQTGEGTNVRILLPEHRISRP